MTADGAITVASAIVIFVAISIGLVSLQSVAEPGFKHRGTMVFAKI